MVSKTNLKNGLWPLYDSCGTVKRPLWVKAKWNWHCHWISKVMLWFESSFYIMCCCYLQSCCCNCASLKTGVVIWAIFDMIFNMSIYAVVSFATRTENLVKTPFSWGLVIILADLGLSCGAYSENICIVVFWQVVYMINIIVLCAIFAFFTILVSETSKRLYIVMGQRIHVHAKFTLISHFWLFTE